MMACNDALVCTCTLLSVLLFFLSLIICILEFVLCLLILILLVFLFCATSTCSCCIVFSVIVSEEELRREVETFGR